MDNCIEEPHRFWEKVLGISGPQWLILMALADFEDDSGVPVHAIASLLEVHTIFVTTQSRILEKKGFLRRQQSTGDVKVLRLSLTDTACKHIDQFGRLSHLGALGLGHYGKSGQQD
jgi:DNA-binding MarR family transcriptional regulator